ncbi:MAG: HEAT repeat domain-containing protein [Planctomycetes bacterium]|nr:HEAT repeat domain-containing protein [Planctomycetota bacterium]
MRAARSRRGAFSPPPPPFVVPPSGGGLGARLAKGVVALGLAGGVLWSLAAEGADPTPSPAERLSRELRRTLDGVETPVPPDPILCGAWSMLHFLEPTAEYDDLLALSGVAFRTACGPIGCVEPEVDDRVAPLVRAFRGWGIDLEELTALSTTPAQAVARMRAEILLRRPSLLLPDRTLGHAWVVDGFDDRMRLFRVRDAGGPRVYPFHELGQARFRVLVVKGTGGERKELRAALRESIVEQVVHAQLPPIEGDAPGQPLPAAGARGLAAYGLWIDRLGDPGRAGVRSGLAETLAEGVAEYWEDADRAARLTEARFVADRFLRKVAGRFEPRVKDALLAAATAYEHEWRDDLTPLAMLLPVGGTTDRLESREVRGRAGWLLERSLRRDREALLALEEAAFAFLGLPDRLAVLLSMESGPATAGPDVEQLLGALGHANANVRCLAALRLAASPGRRVEQALEKALLDEDGWVARAALASLRTLAPPDLPVILCDTYDLAPRRQARIGGPLQRQLLAALLSVRDVAVLDAVRHATDDAGEGDEFAAAISTWAVEGYARKAGAAAIPVLAAKLKDRRAPTEARVQAAEALGRLGARSAVPALVAVTRQPDVRLMVAAAGALVRLGEESGFRVLAAGVRDPNAASRAVTERALVEAGSGALEHVLPLLRNVYPRVRASGCRVVGELGGAREAPAVAALLGDESPEVRAAAEAALAALRRR